MSTWCTRPPRAALPGDAHLAQDVTQEVFIIVARRSATLALHRSIEGWLYTTTRYESSHAIRREQRRRAREHQADAMKELSPEPVLDWNRVRPLLDAAMADLGPRDRNAVIMRYFLGRSFREIGAKHQVTEDGARRRVERALDKLQSLLGRRGVSSTATALATTLAAQAVLAAPAELTPSILAATAGTTAATTWLPISLLHVMTSTKATAAIAVALVLLTAGTAVRELAVRDAAAAALSGVQQRLDATQRRESALQQQVDLAAQPPPMPAPTASPPTSEPATDPAVAGAKFLAAHPEARRLWDARERSLTLAKVGPMFREFGLTAPQTDEMLDLIMRQQTRNTMIDGPNGQMLFHADPTLSPEEFERQARQILGDKFDQIPTYLRRAAAYDLVAELAGAVYRTDPLQPAQMESMTRVLTDASPSYRSGSAFNRWDIDWDQVAANANTVLSPTQRAALSDLRQQATYRRAKQNLGAEAANQP